MSRHIEDATISDVDFKALVDEAKAAGLRLSYAVGSPDRRSYLNSLAATWGKDYDNTVEVHLINT